MIEFVVFIYMVPFRKKFVFCVCFGPLLRGALPTLALLNVFKYFPTNLCFFVMTKMLQNTDNE